MLRTLDWLASTCWRCFCSISSEGRQSQGMASLLWPRTHSLLSLLYEYHLFDEPPNVRDRPRQVKPSYACIQPT